MQFSVVFIPRHVIFSSARMRGLRDEQTERLGTSFNKRDWTLTAGRTQTVYLFSTYIVALYQAATQLS